MKLSIIATIVGKTVNVMTEVINKILKTKEFLENKKHKHSPVRIRTGVSGSKGLNDWPLHHGA